jgi:hypothetical protein
MFPFWLLIHSNFNHVPAIGSFSCTIKVVPVGCTNWFNFGGFDFDKSHVSSGGAATRSANMKPLIIEVRTSRSHGLEVYRVLVNGTIMNEYLSREMANAKARKYVQAWNHETLVR